MHTAEPFPAGAAVAPTASRVALPWLLLLSGFCGISYEILYTKLLGNLLGSQFTINATVLLTFLLGIGLGTLYAHRLARHLWLVEAGIGLYAALMAVFHGSVDHLLYTIAPWVGETIYGCALAALVLLLVPAFLVGCTLPLFAAYLTSMRSSGAFSLTYGVYNVGAALTALATEFALLRTVGLRSATVVLACLNGLVALGVLLLSRSTPLVPRATTDRLRFPGRVLTALAIASVASAVFQLLMIKVAEFILGPYNETFSLVLATVLLGLALGSGAAGLFRLTFRGALLVSLVGLVATLALLPTAATAYAALYPLASESYPRLVFLKFTLVFLLAGLPATGFGATIPALLSSYRDLARESGQLLFASSMANALGFLLMAFVLHRFLDYGPILVVVAAVTAVALVVHAGRLLRPSSLAAAGLVVLAIAARGTTWDEMLLYLGHANFRSLEEMREEQSVRFVAERFKGPQDVFAITWKDGRPYFFINGYLSMPIAGGSAPEKMVGSLSAMLSPRLDEALVLGMGTGATAGAVAVLFDHTDIVEINNVVLQNLHRMADYNLDVVNRPRATIIHDDGIHFIKTTPKEYSLILNTVTSPLYFSSSKLYTRDFLELVKSRLAPDGVYITWLDGKVGDRGFDIIVETLGDSFTECWMSFMGMTYFLVGCSETEMQLAQHEAVAGHPEMRAHFLEEYELPLRLLPYSIVSTDALGLRAGHHTPINTIDFPILEFEMARLPEKTILRKAKQRLEERIDLKRVGSDLARGMDWRPEELAFYVDLLLQRRSYLGAIVREAIAEQLEFSDDEYATAVRRLADEVKGPKAYYVYGKKVAERDPVAGIDFLARAAELDPEAAGVRYYLGKAYEAVGASDEAVASYIAEWELRADRRVPLRVGRVLIDLGRYEEALVWLERASTVGAKERRPEAAYYRGVAWEGLGNPPRARKWYEEVLIADPRHEEARDALKRLASVPHEKRGG